MRTVLQAPNKEALLFQDRYAEWQDVHKCTAVTSTRDTFIEMFDNDDTLEYEPAQTAALILTGGDEEAEQSALEVLPLSSARGLTRQRSQSSQRHVVCSDCW